MNESNEITCKACGNTEPLSNKLKCSKCGAKNWGNKLSNRKGSGILGLIIVIIVILSINKISGYVTNYRDTHWSESKIEKLYTNNLGLVYHSFVFKLTFEDVSEEPVYFIKNSNGSFSQWKKDMEPNYATGSGLLLNSKGRCVTSGYMGIPWEKDLVNPELNREIATYRRAFNINGKATLSGFTIKLGFYLNGTGKDDHNSFTSCNYMGGYEEGKLAVIDPQQTSRTFDNVSFLSLNKEHTINKAGEKLFMLAFPQTDKEIANGVKMNAVLIPGELLASDNDTDKKGYINYSFAAVFANEGSPVFNTSGEVIAFNTMEQNIWQGLRTHIRKDEK
ncbi:MAG: hypothetical protein JWN76_2594 [Chitinophagaceae bacterium]|nr:hypothetical protein [Chitinophagaceae bacterium]